MRTGTRWLFALAVGLLVGSWQAASADPAPAVKPTTVTVPDMDCAGCAKKLIAKLKEVPGVVKAEADLEKKTIKVTPRAGFAVSPKEVWEAVEKGGKKPQKLEGPSGVFTEKPKS